MFEFIWNSRCNKIKREFVTQNFLKEDLKTVNIPFLGLFKRHAFSANSTLKPCLKSTRMNIFTKSWYQPQSTWLARDCDKFTRMHFSQLWYCREHSGIWMHAEMYMNYKVNTMSHNIDEYFELKQSIEIICFIDKGCFV